MRALGFPVTKTEVKKIVREYDREESGRIGFSDFMEIITERTLQRDPDEEIRKAFKLFDEDDTGHITMKVRGLCVGAGGESVSCMSLKSAWGGRWSGHWFEKGRG